MALTRLGITAKQNTLVTSLQRARGVTWGSRAFLIGRENRTGCGSDAESTLVGLRRSPERVLYTVCLRLCTKRDKDLD